jgi:hypothetical protein
MWALTAESCCVRPCVGSGDPHLTWSWIRISTQCAVWIQVVEIFLFSNETAGVNFKIKASLLILYSYLCSKKLVPLLFDNCQRYNCHVLEESGSGSAF